MTTSSLILSPHEVRAALDGRLGLVVRPVKHKTPCLCGHPLSEHQEAAGYTVLGACGKFFPGVPCPLGVPGDRLCCKETWADVNTDSGPALTYRADHGLHFCQDDAFPVEYDRYPGMSFTMWCGDLWRGEPGHTWRRAQHMPAWASRITLEVVGVRCVRVQELTEEDAMACGSYLGRCPCAEMNRKPQTPLESKFRQTWCHVHGEEFRSFWNAKYAKRGLGWETNPFVWAAEVRRVEG